MKFIILGLLASAAFSTAALTPVTTSTDVSVMHCGSCGPKKDADKKECDKDCDKKECDAPKKKACGCSEKCDKKEA